MASAESRSVTPGSWTKISVSPTLDDRFGDPMPSIRLRKISIARKTASLTGVRQLLRFHLQDQMHAAFKVQPQVEMFFDRKGKINRGGNDAQDYQYSVGEGFCSSLVSPNYRLTLGTDNSCDGLFVELDLHVIIHAHDHGLVLDQTAVPWMPPEVTTSSFFLTFLSISACSFCLSFCGLMTKNQKDQKNKNIRDDRQRNEGINGSFNRHCLVLSVFELRRSYRRILHASSLTRYGIRIRDELILYLFYERADSIAHAGAALDPLLELSLLIDTTAGFLMGRNGQECPSFFHDGTCCG